MEKCVSCQFYDRKAGKQATDGRAIQWGQCRRTAPMLNPVNAKSYMIEGVWPTVRDDDWCGEWKTQGHRIEPRITESLTTPLVAPPPMMPSIPTSVPRVSPLNGMAAASAIGALPSPPRPGSLMPANGAVSHAMAATPPAAAPRVATMGGDD